jgi:SnoaL-like domain
MDKAGYDRYLARFNARDYAGVLDFYAAEFEISFAGYTLRTRAAVLDFYKFLHAHLRETITVQRFVSDERFLAIEAIVRIEGLVDLTAGALRSVGLDRMFPLLAAQVIEIPQFIHYHLVDGKIVKALCAVFETPPGDRTPF